METVSARLKKILQMRGINQKDFVEMSRSTFDEAGMKLSESKLSQYVTGKFTPDQGMIALLAEVLDVNPAWLAGWDAPMKTLTSEESADERMEIVKDVFPRLNTFDQKLLVAEMIKKASEK